MSRLAKLHEREQTNAHNQHSERTHHQQEVAKDQARTGRNSHAFENQIPKVIPMNFNPDPQTIPPGLRDHDLNGFEMVPTTVAEDACGQSAGVGAGERR